MRFWAPFFLEDPPEQAWQDWLAQCVGRLNGLSSGVLAMQEAVEKGSAAVAMGRSEFA